MVDRVEPLAHGHAFLQLNLDLFLAERLEEHEGDGSVEANHDTPAGKKSGAHDRGEVTLADEEHVGRGVDGAGEEGALIDALSVVKSINNSSVELPIVVIHVSSFY